jgi:hypothetical protein
METSSPRLREAHVIALVERSISLLEWLGGLDQRDQLLFKDIVRSKVLTASSGLLPGAPADDELNLSDAWLEVFQEVLPRGSSSLTAPRQVKSYQRSWLIDTLRRFRAQLAGE